MIYCLAVHLWTVNVCVLALTWSYVTTSVNVRGSMILRMEIVSNGVERTRCPTVKVCIVYKIDELGPYFRNDFEEKVIDAL